MPAERNLLVFSSISKIKSGHWFVFGLYPEQDIGFWGKNDNELHHFWKRNWRPESRSELVALGRLGIESFSHSSTASGDASRILVWQR